jgi:hypothetical protein
VCWIGFLVYLDVDGNAREGSFEMMREIQEVLVPLGGTPHWGKHMCADLYNWKELYPEWDTFKVCPYLTIYDRILWRKWILMGNGAMHGQVVFSKNREWA